MKTLIIPDPHAHPDHSNDRALALGKFMYDLKPDKVVCLGDGADMPSLSSHDKGKRSFVGANYLNDINSWLDFQDKLWHTYRRNKKGRPVSTFLIGNHEQRIEKAQDQHPELQGTITMDDLELDYEWDIVVPYEGSTPGVWHQDETLYAHFMVSGVMNRPISGVNLARELVRRTGKNSVVGHNHTINFEIHKPIHGTQKFGLCAGAFIDYQSSWAGQAQDLWWNGVTVLEKDKLPHFYSIERIKKDYE